MATAFAIYSTTDNSLTFYKRDIVPAVGDTFENKVVTNIYTGFETAQYASSSMPPWYNDGAIKKVTNVSFIDTISPVALDQWFRDGKLITSLNLTNLDTSNCTSMQHTFRECGSLTTLDVSSFNTSKVTNMSCLFYNCNNLEELDVSNFDTSSLTNMTFMFYALMQCNIIGLQSLKTDKVTSLQSTFYKCCSVKNFDLSSWNTSKCTNMSYTFAYGAGSTINLVGWNTSKVTTMTSMFASSYFTYLDLSTFSFEALTNANSMFLGNEVLKTIVVSFDWADQFQDSDDVWWMFENCHSLMGDVSYAEAFDHSAPLEETYPYMGGFWGAKTKGGYLTMKHEEPEGGEGDGEEGDDGEVTEKTYLVLGSTLSDIARSMRKITGTPTKITLKNFSKVLDNQINSAEAVTVMFKDRRYTASDIETVGYIHYTNSSFKYIKRGINRFMVFPAVLKGSIISFTELLSLEDGKGEIRCADGDVTKLDSTSFIVNGDCTIEIIQKTYKEV